MSERRPTMAARLACLKAALVEIAEQCEGVAADDSIHDSERRTWLLVARCARNFAAEKHA
jgi:hypothetical protein